MSATNTDANVNANNKRTISDENSDNKRLMTRKQLANCTICEQNDQTKASLQCSKCNLNQHIDCIGMTPTFHNYLIKNKSYWCCFNCNTPDTVQFKQKLDALNGKISNKNKEIDAKLKDLEVKQLSLTSQSDIILKAIENTNSRVDKQQLYLCSLEQKFTREISYIQAHHRRCNLLISGIPVMANEDLYPLILSLFQHFQLNFDRKQIAKVHRLKSTTSGSNLPPTILLTLRNNEDKELLFGKYLSCVTKKAPLTVNMHGFTGSSRIFINKQLPSILNHVYKLALDFKRSGKVKMVIVKNSYLKIGVADKWFKVQTVAELLEATKTSCSSSASSSNSSMSV